MNTASAVFIREACDDRVLMSVSSFILDRTAVKGVGMKTNMMPESHKHTKPHTQFS
jgi:hypothetical protein